MQLARTGHLNLPGADTGFPRQSAEPYGNHRADIGRHINVYREPGICRTEVDRSSPIVHQPPSTPVRGHAGEFEAHGDAPLRKHAGVDASADVPYQYSHVQIVFRQRILGKSQPPLTKLLNHGAKRGACLGKMPLTCTLPLTTALHDTDAFQFFQAL